MFRETVFTEEMNVRRRTYEVKQNCAHLGWKNLNTENYAAHMEDPLFCYLTFLNINTLPVLK